MYGISVNLENFKNFETKFVHKNMTDKNFEKINIRILINI